MVRRISGVALAGLAILALSACESIGKLASAVGEAAKETDTLLHETAGALTKADEVTGRRSLNLDTKQGDYERGASTFARILSDPTKVGAQPGARPLPAIDPRYRRLERIFGRIVSASHAADETGRPAEFALIDDPQWNALALGGNKAVFFTGLTESLNDDELAAVVGHELAHNAAAHISEHAAARMVSLATKRGRKKGWNEAYTYKHEQEADDLGILYAALAGYDPYAAAALWEKKADTGYEWFRTHPTSVERVRRNRETAGKVRQYYRPGRVNPEAKAVLNCNVLYCRRETPSLQPGFGGGLLALTEAVQSVRQQYKDVKEEWKRQKEEIARQGKGNEGARPSDVGYRKGEWSSPDGHRYVGEFLDGKFHGKGAYYWPDGERYEGEFWEGKFHGFGKWMMTGGERYIGQVRNGKFHGCGAYIWPDGEHYAGEFRNDEFNGLGSYAWPNGRVKTCDWRDDKEVTGSCIEHRASNPLPARAKAVCSHRAARWGDLPAIAGKSEEARTSNPSRSGERYEGEYRDGKRHGRGILTFSNGDRYEGSFVDGEIHGRGGMYRANGDMYFTLDSRGSYNSSGLQGCGVYRRANGDRYMGEFQDGKFHGRGTYEWTNGKGATCDWRDDEAVAQTCLEHPVVGLGKKHKGKGVCLSLSDEEILTMEKRHREKECRQEFKGENRAKDRSSGYEKCIGRIHSGLLAGFLSKIGHVNRLSDDWKRTTELELKKHDPGKGVYEGKYRKGVRHGRGALLFLNGDRYDCSFENGELRGCGVIHAANGSIYASDEGFGFDGAQHCVLYIGAEGDRYMGEFRNGRFHGRGTYERADGEGITCDWDTGRHMEGTCLRHPAVGIGERTRGDSVCGSLGDSDILSTEHRRRDKECRRQFGRGAAEYRECRERMRSGLLSGLAARNS